MKLNYIIFIVFIFPLFTYGQNQVLDIEDRLNLPFSVYDSLKKYDLILCGEMHGTNEAPQFMEGLVKLWNMSGKKVVLALEIPDNSQHEMDSFMLTKDTTIIQKMLFFNSVNYGISGKAMLRLLINLGGRLDVKILCFDPSNQEGKQMSGQMRDSLMAENIERAVQAFPGYTLLLLSGNIHSSLIKTGKSMDFRTLGYFLKQNPLFSDRIISLNFLYHKGKAWNCMRDGCKERDLQEINTYFTNYGNQQNFMLLSGRFMDVCGCDGIFYTREVTASRPWKE